VDLDNIGLALPKGERRKTFKVVPLGWVIWIVSILFVGWNVVGYRLLESYLDKREAKHSGDGQAHQILVDKINDRQTEAMKAVLAKLEDINTRLSRIEGAIASVKK